jgi:hypothetical protein
MEYLVGTSSCIKYLCFASELERTVAGRSIGQAASVELEVEKLNDLEVGLTKA